MGAQTDSSPSITGSLRRVTLHNFQNYADVEVIPGPRLNIVVGPNGSGKSALVNAMALAMGAHPRVLGRGERLGSFIMRGKEEGWVEIELNTPPHNLVLRREFLAKKPTASTWKMNGEKQTEMAVKSKLHDLRIHVDNLCTFLPQDRVASFSQLDPEGLLIETEKTLLHNDIDMLGTHNELCEIQEKSEERLDRENCIATELEVLRTKESTMKRGVERLRQREEALKKVYILEQAKLWLIFEEMRIPAREAKDRLNVAKENLDKAKKKLNPLEEASRSAEVSLEKARIEERKCVADRKAHDKKRKELSAEIERIQEDLISATISLENQEHKIKKREAHKDMCVTNLTAKQDEIEKLDFKGAHEFISKKSEMAVNLNDTIGELSEDLQKIHRLRNHDYALMSKLTARLNWLRDEGSRKLQNFGNVGHDQKKVLEIRKWIKENSKNFLQPVYGPVAVELNITDPVMAQILESHASKDSLSAFITCCLEDDNTLTQYIQATYGELRVTVGCIEGGRMKPSPATVWSDSAMKRLKHEKGALGWLDKGFQAPDAVRQFLRDRHSIHNVLIGGERLYETLTHAQKGHQFLDELTRGESKKQQQAAIFTISSDKLVTFFSTKISRFSGDLSISTRIVGPSRMLSTSVDQEQVTNLEAQLSDLRDQEAKFAEEQTLKEKERKDMDGRRISLRKEMDQAHEVIDQYKEGQKRITELQRKIDSDDQFLSHERHTEKEKLFRRIKGCFKRVVKVSQELVVESDRSLESIITHNCSQLTKDHSSQISNTKAALLKDAKRNYSELVSSVEKEAEVWQNVKMKLKAAQDEAKMKAPMQDKNGDPTEFGIKWSSTPPQVPHVMEEVDAQLTIVRDTIRGVEADANLLQHYKDLQAKVTAKEMELNGISTQNAAVKAKLDRLKGPWKQYLRDVVALINERFSVYMKDMECRGEIVLADSDPKYRKWGIKLKVAFRNDEGNNQLKVLSSSTHSGGECSVSTILYLMALQNINKASPIRVVDEINQGMDQVNERLAFGRIVRNSTGPQSSSQYFLITPKLLQGLVAMENKDVTVHFVFNGPWVPLGGGRNFRMDQMYLKVDRRKELNRSIKEEEGAVISTPSAALPGRKKGRRRL